MEELAFLENASAAFTDLEMCGPACPPLPFDQATTGRAERVDAAVYNPVTHDVLEVSNIIYERHPDGRPPERAYWIGRKLKKCIFGVVKECTVLKFRNDVNVPWEVTGHKAAAKIMSWQKIRDLQHIEDPQKEVAAMQYVSQNGAHPHVMGVLDVLQDDDYLLMFMPFCSSGDLFGFVQSAGRFPEPMARHWFRQLLEVRAPLFLSGPFGSHLYYVYTCNRFLVQIYWFLTNFFVLIMFYLFRVYPTCSEWVFVIETFL
jgi:hypothetical protein